MGGILAAGVSVRVTAPNILAHKERSFEEQRNQTSLTLAVAVLGLFASTERARADLISNGSFETGDFTGWTVLDQGDGSGSWFHSRRVRAAR